MVTKQKHFLDSLRNMVSKTGESVCPNCQKTYEGSICPECDSNKLSSDSAQQTTTTAYLVDLVSNHKIKIPVPGCKVGRDEANDIVVSGDQSISRHHLSILNEDHQYYIEDENSRHGTFLNGSQIHKREPINDGDVVKIGVSLFWFVIEDAINASEEIASTTESSEKGNEFEQTHLTVQPETQNQPSDPSTSTMNEIPVMSNEQSLLERLRHKTRSFDQPGVFSQAQAQPGSIAPSQDTDPIKSLSETQAILPSLKTELEAMAQEAQDSPLPAGSIEDLSAQTVTAKLTSLIPSDLVPSQTDTSVGSAIYNQLLRSDLSELNAKYDDLKNTIEKAQTEMEQIASQLTTIKELGNNLVGGTGTPLIQACHKVFDALGWQITNNPTDPQELQLRINGQLAIGRVIWTDKEPVRGDLGQLSIAQTNLWCEQGDEPKGILIVSRLPNETGNIADLTQMDYESELTKYANKKNVCMLTSLQILAIYRDLIIKQHNSDELREKIITSSGWLPGFTLNPIG